MGSQTGLKPFLNCLRPPILADERHEQDGFEQQLVRSLIPRRASSFTRLQLVTCQAMTDITFGSMGWRGYGVASKLYAGPQVLFVNHGGF